MTAAGAADIGLFRLRMYRYELACARDYVRLGKKDLAVSAVRKAKLWRYLLRHARVQP